LLGINARTGFLGGMNLEQIRVPFDLKMSKLEGRDWPIFDKKLLAGHLYERQGNFRKSYENRLFILFIDSPSSSTIFLQRNEIVMIREILEMLKSPEKFWFPLWVGNEPKKVWSCIILIQKNHYLEVNGIHQHDLGNGLREIDKAEFSTKFMQHLSLVSDGQIIPNNNTKEHGIDGYILLPKTLIACTLS
jgi:hypothetical protein